MKYQTLLDGGGWIRWCGKRGGKKEERREDTGKALEGKEPGWILEGGKRRGPEPSRTGININLNIGTEYRVQIADALGKELHHPIMSNLWDSETGPTYRLFYRAILSGQFIRPVHQTSLSGQFIRPVYLDSLSGQFIRTVYQDSLSGQLLRPSLCVSIIFISHPVFMKTRQLYQSNDISLKLFLCISFKKGYISKNLCVYYVIKKWSKQTNCVSCFTKIYSFFAWFDQWKIRHYMLANLLYWFGVHLVP